VFSFEVSGTVLDLQGQPRTGPAALLFALYKEETGGAPVWLEAQSVSLDPHGKFTVFLGADSREGIPLNVFESGETRWLGINPDDGIERARVLLSSVPYALKAADAQTLNGKSSKMFVTRDQLGPILRAKSNIPAPRWPTRFPVSDSSSTLGYTFEATGQAIPSQILASQIRAGTMTFSMVPRNEIRIRDISSLSRSCSSRDLENTMKLDPAHFVWLMVKRFTLTPVTRIVTRFDFLSAVAVHFMRQRSELLLSRQRCALTPRMRREV
jgi:hypothetical protein